MAILEGVSEFPAHFKAAMAMGPLQFQKQRWLQEARGCC